nr:NAD(P)H-dependent oxidoreductase [Enterococcus sp. RIT-PI-f]
MTNTLVIASHPNYQQSLSQRFFTESAKIPGVTLHFLDTLDHFVTEDELTRLSDCDRLILQFPLYWYSVPAKLKAWIDQIWAEAEPFLSGKEIGFAISTGVAAKEFQLGGQEQISFNELLRPQLRMAQKYQMTVLPLIILDQFMYKTENQKRKFVVDYQQLLTMPSPFSFDQKQRWFADQLRTRVETKPQLAPLLTRLEENRELIEDLTDALNSLEEPF